MKLRPAPTPVESSAPRRSPARGPRREAGLSGMLDARTILDLQKKSGNASVRGALSGARSLVAAVVTSGDGQPLDDVTRARLEERFGLDLDGVRIHMGERASNSATLLGAHAYSVGDHIVFQRELYRPHSEAGLKMLAHEIAHVIQHRAASAPARSIATGLHLADPTGRLEDNADRATRES